MMTRASGLFLIAASHLLLAGTVEAQGVSFTAPTNFGAGISPHSVAVADFNGDGAQDLAVANAGVCYKLECDAGSVSVLLGNGDGSFQPAQDFGAGRFLVSVAVGDFNGDGTPDLAVANLVSNVSVLLGNGDGSFQAAQDFGAGSSPASVAVGDFNGDGAEDLAVANFGSDNVSVLLGNGNGSFRAAQNFGVGSRPHSVAVGDFNGDGIKDLAVANNYSNDVSVFLGNGDGSFRAAQNFRGAGPVSVAVGDFNGDSIQDLAVAKFDSNNVSVSLGNGDGSFQGARNFGTGGRPVSVAVGDFNSDGLQDLAVAYMGSPPFYVSGVSVLLGNGDGSFQAAQDFGAGFNPYWVAVGDFNGDVKPDLAVANAGSDNVSVLINTTPMAKQTSNGKK